MSWPSPPPAWASARSRSPPAMCSAPDQAASRSPWVPLPAPGGASSSSLTVGPASPWVQIGTMGSVAQCGQFGRDDDVAFLNLTGRALGERVDDPHVARVLVGRDLALDVIAEFLGGDDGTGLERHRGGDLLAQGRVRQPDDGGLGDRRVLVEDLLDLARVHVVAAADDQVLLPVDDVEVAAGVDPGQVAGVEPAVADRLGGGLRALPVALHHVRPADDDLADLAWGHLAAFLVDPAQLTR